MGRGGLGSTGPCFERQVGSGTNQVPRPLSSLSQYTKKMELKIFFICFMESTRDHDMEIEKENGSLCYFTAI